MKRAPYTAAATTAALLLLPLLSTAFAADAKPHLDTGDTAWMLMSAALVFLMTPGLAFFYGGLTRAQSVLNTMMMSMVSIGLVGVLWMLAGYSLAFGDGGAWLGDFAHLGLNGLAGQLTGTIPTYVFASFQAMFAIIAVALISGAVVERMRFGAFILFAALWTLIIYSPLAHWVWGANGWLFKDGALDFAGGTVIHISAGVSALVAAWLLGPRLGYPRNAHVPHNVPLVLLGAGLLWFGWMGFNAGSALGANQTAALAFITTLIAPAAAMLTWLGWESLSSKPTAVGAATGLVVGLVAITPACAFVSPWAAVLLGILGATASYWTVQAKHRLMADDALDVFACHGVAGIVGALLTGLLAWTTGSGKPIGAQFMTQLISVVASLLYAGVGSFILLKLVSLVIPLRVPAGQEIAGIDLSAHQEQGYSENELGIGAPVFLGGD
ncbi:ammonium transporter [Deinococcus radiodurans]|uniref:Ammonium transporter n=1 Tax=Deinococcus radiodurans (strain ATCC 13939 / DSM 20539 / JCM 16871 / CCUG 27074 / LMG 4051 / NBRC 15346 / NCIMB 9279 / VKM B-1422 / R1) TaxID=243230 RepID=Q9RWH5_DEIRA|nr:ammonium transporter [Deinococcus radiodurans R1 = ATCC 13939 = DSM 20539]QEM72633.1 ammonium transporter [Deinococcus radiodurans]ANC72081.1 ammonia channel protein [Deinococcus radiodurans R1 = ATCC 13939 = DSM 20539]UDK99864.1 ammonium transporter [Deinococcus radiodurans R1 = ATCC 13939 = DSM 20539]UID69693.1 ammonia channel protein [Deinococcus radiodurans R1 = ATCC 13939 = DSM 20539]